MAAKLIKLEGGKGKHGPIHAKRVQIECKDCGNKERFYGTAYTNPMIVIEKQGFDTYDVVEMSYKSGEDIDEVIERCAVCGASRDRLNFIPFEESTNVLP